MRKPSQALGVTLVAEGAGVGGGWVEGSVLSNKRSNPCGSVGDGAGGVGQEGG